MLNSYNRIAFIYSLASKLVYGNTLTNIQHTLIKQLPQDGRLLIIGGGDGSILPFIYNNSPNLQLQYMEASSEMLKLAQSNAPKKQNIQFIHSDDFNKLDQEFNYIYAGFLFDLFPESKSTIIINELESKTLNDLTWYVADFEINKHTKRRRLRLFQMKLSIIFSIN